jgi:hypothetical protein
MYISTVPTVRQVTSCLGRTRKKTGTSISVLVFESKQLRRLIAAAFVLSGEEGALLERGI